MLFNQYDIDNGYNYIILYYFERMYEDSDFLRAIDLLSKKSALNTDGAYCHFSDINCSDEIEHFKGVEFAIGYPPTEEDTIVVSEKTCYSYVKLACERYLKYHPKDATEVHKILSRMPT